MKPSEFRDVLSRFAAGVTVITTRDAQGARVGFTATAFSSVSLEPPLVLFCVGAGGRSDLALAAGSGFAVSVLGERQADVAMRFTLRSMDDRFEGVLLTAGDGGLPVLNGAIATLTCEHAGRVEAGDHVVYLGHVVSGSSTDGRPLLHFRGEFDELAGRPVDAGRAADFMIGAAW
jgi:flavin reductase (DIM6/NTAB) family NADH-FMN oxidoreductase RutF